MKKAIVDNAVELLRMFLEDEDAGKVLRERTTMIINLLSHGGELAVEKALIQLEEISSLGLSSYHRTQVWDVVSLLESAKE